MQPPGALEQVDPVLSLAAVADPTLLPKTRVWGPTPEIQPRISPPASLSSTTCWGCAYSYDGTVVGRLVGLDYALNRYYSSSLGRFMTPDPYRASGGPGDPGSWNRYAYVMGDPINGNDPTGTITVSTGDGFCTVGVGEYATIVPCDVLTVQGDKITVDKPGLLDEWDNLSDDCKSALRTALHAGPIDMVKALNRAVGSMATLMTATAGTGIDWTMLAAIGIRETGFKDINQSGGKGVGVFQIDLGQNPSVTSTQASNPLFAAKWAANVLSTNMNTFASEYPNLDPAQLLQATAASYNIGAGGISGNPATIDQGTTGNNYGSNILGLMSCF